MSADNLLLAYTVLLGVQCVHSIEELSTGFHKKWYLFKMPFAVFLSFEIVFLALWLSVLFFPALPNRDLFMQFFIWLMLANGIQHLLWAAIVKKYVPGLVTAPLFIIVFLIAKL